METSQPNFDRDLEHLKLLSIFHYVVGGITILWSSLFIIHASIAAVMYFNPKAIPRPPGGPEFPRELLLVFAIMAGAAVLLGWIFGIVTIASGRMIGRRRHRLFSLVVAGINCAAFPFGTILGVCTILVLSRVTVRELYEAEREDESVA